MKMTKINCEHDWIEIDEVFVYCTRCGKEIDDD